MKLISHATMILLVITATAGAKVVTTTHRNHCKSNYSPATAFLGSRLTPLWTASRVESKSILIPTNPPTFAFCTETIRSREIFYVLDLRNFITNCTSCLHHVVPPPPAIWYWFHIYNRNVQIMWPANYHQLEKPVLQTMPKLNMQREFRNFATKWIRDYIL